MTRPVVASDLSEPPAPHARRRRHKAAGGTDRGSTGRWAGALLALWTLGAEGPALAASPPARTDGAKPAASAPAHAGSHSAGAARRALARRLFAEGKKRFALRQFRRALQAFSRAYEVLPLSGFLFNIGQCHRFLGDCHKAIFFYEGFIRENPGTPDAAFVRKLVDRCKRAEARVRARRERARRLFEQGRRAATLQQYREAIERFRAAYKAYPRPGYLYHLAEAYRAAGAYEKAVHFYKAYLRENPGTPEAKSVRARIGRTQALAEQARRSRRRNLTGGAIPPKKRPPAPPRPFYKRWWFWTAIAASVVTAVGLGVGLTRDSGNGDAAPTLGTFDIGGSLQ